MFGSKTTVADVEKWSDAKAVDKVARALSDRDPTVRAASASALRHVDPNDARKATFDAAVNSLLKHLTSADRGLVEEAARALGYLGSNEALGPLFATLDHHTDDAGVCAAASWAIAHVVDAGTDNANAFRLVFDRLSQQPAVLDFSRPGLSATAFVTVLYELAKVWVGHAPHGRSEIEDSAWGRAFVAVPHGAGRQLIRAAKGKSREVAAFGARLESRDLQAKFEKYGCGLNHSRDAKCVCIRCGNISHDLSHGCVCRRCGQGHHDWSEGVINGYDHPCRHCRAYMHHYSGNITEP